MKEIGPAILAAQPIVRSRGVEDCRRGGFGQTCDRQQVCRSEIRYDQPDALCCKIAKSGCEVAVRRCDTLNELERLAGEMPGRIVVGDTEPCTLYAFILRRLIEIGKRQCALDHL